LRKNKGTDQDLLLCTLVFLLRAFRDLSQVILGACRELNCSKQLPIAANSSQWQPTQLRKQQQTAANGTKKLQIAPESTKS